VKNEGVICFIS